MINWFIQEVSYKLSTFIPTKAKSQNSQSQSQNRSHCSQRKNNQSYSRWLLFGWLGWMSITCFLWCCQLIVWRQCSKSTNFNKTKNFLYDLRITSCSQFQVGYQPNKTLCSPGSYIYLFEFMLLFLKVCIAPFTAEL